MAGTLNGALPSASLSGTYGNAVSLNNAGNIFGGSGAGLTSLNASSLSSGTVADARLSADVALLNGNQAFTGTNTFVSSVHVADKPVFLRTGTNDGVGWFGSSPNFAGVFVDGPVLFGDSGGALGTDPGGVETIALRWNTAGTVMMGSGTNTAEPPDKGLIIRRVRSTTFSIGSIVARTDTLMLERDGFYGGWRIVNVANPGSCTVAATGLTATGATVTFVLAIAGTSAGTNAVFSDPQGVISFRCSFGDSYSLAHMTEVSLTRYPGDYFWTGTLTSTFNQ